MKQETAHSCALFARKVIDTTLIKQMWICHNFCLILSCSKQVHVNFSSSYFQLDANRLQNSYLRRVREHPECLCSLPPLKQPQDQTKRAGYCHQYWKGTILNKYVTVMTTCLLLIYIHCNLCAKV